MRPGSQEAAMSARGTSSVSCSPQCPGAGDHVEREAVVLVLVGRLLPDGFGGVLGDHRPEDGDPRDGGGEAIAIRDVDLDTTADRPACFWKVGSK